MDLRSDAAVLAENISALKDAFPNKNELVRLSAAAAGNISAALSAGYARSVMQLLQNAKHALNEAETLLAEAESSEHTADEIIRIKELMEICRKNLYTEIKRTARHIC